MTIHKDISKYSKQINGLINDYVELTETKDNLWSTEIDLPTRYSIVSNSIMAFMFLTIREVLDKCHSKEMAIITCVNDLRSHFEQYISVLIKEYKEKLMTDDKCD